MVAHYPYNQFPRLRSLKRAYRTTSTDDTTIARTKMIHHVLSVETRWRALKARPPGSNLHRLGNTSCGRGKHCKLRDEGRGVLVLRHPLALPPCKVRFQSGVGPGCSNSREGTRFSFHRGNLAGRRMLRRGSRPGSEISTSQNRMLPSTERSEPGVTAS